MAVQWRLAYCRRCRQVAWRWRDPWRPRHRLLAPLSWGFNAAFCRWECCGCLDSRAGEAW